MVGVWIFLVRKSEILWSVAHRFAHQLRMVDKQQQWCDADITFTIPIDLGFSWEQGPKLHWQASKEPATAQTDDALPQHTLDGLTNKISFESGHLDITKGKFAVELSVNPNNDQDLCLELRSVRDKTRLHIALTPQDLPTTHQQQTLPKIERHGMAMQPQARQELLQQLSLAAQMQGISLPVQLEQEVTVR